MGSRFYRGVQERVVNGVSLLLFFCGGGSPLCHPPSPPLDHFQMWNSIHPISTYIPIAEKFNFLQPLPSFNVIIIFHPFSCVFPPPTPSILFHPLNFINLLVDEALEFLSQKSFIVDRSLPVVSGHFVCMYMCAC